MKKEVDEHKEFSKREHGKSSNLQRQSGWERPLDLSEKRDNLQTKEPLIPKQVTRGQTAKHEQSIEHVMLIGKKADEQLITVSSIITDQRSVITAVDTNNETLIKQDETKTKSTRITPTKPAINIPIFVYNGLSASEQSDLVKGMHEMSYQKMICHYQSYKPDCSTENWNKKMFLLPEFK